MVSSTYRFAMVTHLCFRMKDRSPKQNFKDLQKKMGKKKPKTQKKIELAPHFWRKFFPLLCFQLTQKFLISVVSICMFFKEHTLAQKFN